MLGNCRFPLSTLLTLLIIGLYSVVTHAQSTQAAAVSRFGTHRPERANRGVPLHLRAHAVPQLGINFSFGLIDFPRSPDGAATGLNSHGDVVGFYGPNVPAWDGTEQSFFLHGNTFEEILYPGATYTGAIGINRRKEIVGWYAETGTDGISHAFLRKGKNYTNIDDPAFQYTAATNINDSGEIIGEAYDDIGPAHGFILSKGVYTTIDPPNSTYTAPIGINSDGVIVGEYDDANFVIHGFIYQKGQFTTVDYPGASNTSLTSINDQGQMLGGYGDDVIIGDGEWPTPNAFLLDQGNFTPFLPPVSDAQVTWTYTLNGETFVGMYVDSLGNIHGFEAQINGAR